MRRRLTFLCICLLTSFASVALGQGTPDGETPADEDVCTGLIGAAFGLCNAYCEAMDCHCYTDGTCQPNATEKACDRVKGNFHKIVGADEPIPCLCGDGVLDPGEECDDGNNDDGDGCSAACTIEDTATCPCIIAANWSSEDAYLVWSDFFDVETGIYMPTICTDTDTPPLSNLEQDDPDLDPARIAVIDDPDDGYQCLAEDEGFGASGTVSNLTQAEAQACSDLIVALAEGSTTTTPPEGYGLTCPAP